MPRIHNDAYVNMSNEPPKKAVILEKHHGYRDYLKPLMRDEGIVSYSFESESSCLDNLSQLDPSFIVFGSRNLESTLKFINALKAVECRLPVVMITNDHPVEKYIRSNGFDNMITLKTRMDVKDVKDGIRWAVNRQKPKDRFDGPYLIGGSKALTTLNAVVPALCRSRENVVLQGEKGTGKETLARVIHHHAQAKRQSAGGLFMKIDAAALVDQAEFDWMGSLNTNLGHFDAHAPAHADNKGSCGTLFIKDVDLLPWDFQRYILKTIDDAPLHMTHLVEPPEKNLQLIAASRRNLKAMVDQERFRPDLYYRLNVLQFEIPPLRKRTEDIPLLADYFTYKYCRMLQKSYFELSRQTKGVFANYAWPGNVGELEQTVKRIVAGDDEQTCLERLYAADKKLAARKSQDWLNDIGMLRETVDVSAYIRAATLRPLKAISRDVAATIEKGVIQSALKASNWNRKKAAALLNVSYKSMLNKIAAYGLDQNNFEL